MPRYYRTVHATQTVTNKATTNKQSKRRTTKNSTFKEGKQKICASGGVELGDMVQQKPISSEYSSTTKSAELFDLLLSENGFHYGCQWNVIFRVQIGSQSTRTLPCRVSNRRKNKTTTASRTFGRFQCYVSSAKMPSTRSPSKFWWEMKIPLVYCSSSSSKTMKSIALCWKPGDRAWIKENF